MSTITEGLRKIAQDMSEASAWDEIRGAAVESLMENGVDGLTAEQVISSLEDGTGKPVSMGLAELSAIFENVAAYIDELETKIGTSDAELAEKTAELAKVAEEQMKGSMSPFIDKGFSDGELRALAVLPEETLQKLAHNVQIAPTSLGQGAGVDAGSVDPLLAFCMS